MNNFLKKRIRAALLAFLDPDEVEFLKKESDLYRKQTSDADSRSRSLTEKINTDKSILDAIDYATQNGMDISIDSSCAPPMLSVHKDRTRKSSSFTRSSLSHKLYELINSVR